jgi:hypothetical protein
MHTGGGQRGWATGARNTAKQLATALKFPGCIAWIVVIILMAMICIVLDVKGTGGEEFSSTPTVTSWSEVS